MTTTIATLRASFTGLAPSQNKTLGLERLRQAAATLRRAGDRGPKARRAAELLAGIDLDVAGVHLANARRFDRLVRGDRRRRK